jgi:prepilin-type N-terminal cleavage/methylation domain-containing protein
MLPDAPNPAWSPWTRSVWHLWKATAKYLHCKQMRRIVKGRAGGTSVALPDSSELSVETGGAVTRTRHETGFTLVELMIVVVIIGVLASIAIPNFISMQHRAREATVKANMHTTQVSMEDFCIQNDGTYAVDASSALADGRTLAQVCPGGSFPENPFTLLPSVVLFNSDPTSGNPGELAFNPAQAQSYLLKGNGPSGDTLRLVLTTGQY